MQPACGQSALPMKLAGAKTMQQLFFGMTAWIFDIRARLLLEDIGVNMCIRHVVTIVRLVGPWLLAHGCDVSMLIGYVAPTALGRNVESLMKKYGSGEGRVKGLLLLLAVSATPTCGRWYQYVVQTCWYHCSACWRLVVAAGHRCQYQPAEQACRQQGTAMLCGVVHEDHMHLQPGSIKGLDPAFAAFLLALPSGLLWSTCV